MFTERELRQRLSANLRAYRRVAALSAREAAERVDMNVRHWQKIEAGSINVTLHTLVRLAGALGVDAAALLVAPEPSASSSPSASAKAGEQCTQNATPSAEGSAAIERRPRRRSAQS